MDNELPEDQKATLRDHLSKCHICADEYAQLIQLDTDMNALEEVEPSHDFDRVFWQKIERIEKKRFDIWSYMRPLSVLLKPGLAAACVLMLAVALIVYTRHSDPAVDEIVIAEHLEMLEDMDIVSELELLENMDILLEIEDQS